MSMAEFESAGSEVLDPEQLTAVCGGDRSFEEMVIGEFRESTLAALRNLDAAIEARDAVRTKAVAHGIKGSAATLGGQALASICRLLEQASAAPDWNQAAELARAAHAGYAELDAALTAHLAAG